MLPRTITNSKRPAPPVEDAAAQRHRRYRMMQLSAALLAATGVSSRLLQPLLNAVRRQEARP